MPFDSTTARLAGQKSKRGKDKITYELKQKLSLLADGIVEALEVSSLIYVRTYKPLEEIAPYTSSKIQELHRRGRSVSLALSCQNPKSAK